MNTSISQIKNNRYKLTSNWSQVSSKEKRDSALKVLRSAKSQQRKIVVIRRDPKVF